jgi:hypothetical protein
MVNGRAGGRAGGRASAALITFGFVEPNDVGCEPVGVAVPPDAHASVNDPLVNGESPRRPRRQRPVTFALRRLPVRFACRR